jgi:hypothetical protein
MPKDIVKLNENNSTVESLFNLYCPRREDVKSPSLRLYVNSVIRVLVLQKMQHSTSWTIHICPYSSAQPVKGNV